MRKILKDGSFAATGFIPSGLATSPDGVDFRKRFWKTLHLMIRKKHKNL